MKNSFLAVEQKKGDVNTPIGLMTVYARITTDGNSTSSQNPLFALAQNGLLVAQGNYRDQSSLRDFLQQELGTSLDDEEGIREFVEHLGGIEGALDPEKFQEKLAEIEDMEEFIPTPAKMSSFESEEAILAEEGDVFFAGKFENSANANLAINAIAILYQARFRETQISSLRGEIEGMISQLDEPQLLEELPHKEERQSLALRKTSTEGLTAEEILSEALTRYVPELFHGQQEKSLFKQEVDAFLHFFSSYPHKDDLARIISLIEGENKDTPHMKDIELLIKKIAYLLVEDFDRVAQVVQEIQKIENEL